MAKRRGDIKADMFAPTEPAGKEAAPAGESEEKKVKVTYYLAANVVDRLDLAQVKLRPLTGKRGHELSKSAIVEAALRLALEELEELGEDSQLVSLIK